MKPQRFVLLALLFPYVLLHAQQKVINVSLSYEQAEEVICEDNKTFGAVSVQNLASLNSDDMDYSPLLYQDGLVFTSTRYFEDEKRKRLKSYKKKFSYLFFSRRDDRGRFLEPTPLKGTINGKHHEGAASFNKEGDIMFFTRNNHKGKNEFGKVELKIYTAKFVDGAWGETVEVKAINGDGFSTCHPTISSDGTKLFFASNRNGGFGGMDIYVSYLVDGEWQYPMNLGPGINTDGNESFPFIDKNNKLYFSSDEHDGKGGLDIFVSTWLDTEDEQAWTKIQNLGYPFNSEKDDFAFSIYNNSQDGFFTSTRDGGKGFDDIYIWNKKPLAQAMR